MNEDTITISKQLFEQLVEDSYQLNHLHNTGVDNWEGYSYYKHFEED
jgi:hypothetical protein